MLLKLGKFIGKWVVVVAACLVVVALASDRATAKAAYNQGVDVGSWGLGTSASGVPRFFQGAADAFKANNETDARKVQKAVDQAEKASKQ